MLIRSRIVLPMTAPPLEDGAVLVSRDRIQAVGRFSDLRRLDAEVVDLGDVVVLPGLINSHCHLDYTRLMGRLVPPKTFPDWIKSILAAKSEWQESDYAASWLDGARQLLESGTTSVVNIESVPTIVAGCRQATPLRVFSHLEMTGVRSGLDPASILDRALAALRNLEPGRAGLGLSPHAPYSTLPALIEGTARQARAAGIRTTTHVAESHAESEMFLYRRGPMFSWLEPQRPMDDCGIGSPVQHLERHGLLGPDHIAVHANYLWDGDVERLARSGTHVVHCPTSHDYFGHQRFPLEPLRSAGVNLTLGTDSLASTRVIPGRRVTLSLLAEVREFLSKNSLVSPLEALAWITVHGARALGVDGRLGELSPGALADLIAIPHSGAVEDAVEAVVNHGGCVSASLIDGEWAIAPGESVR
ncbi:MAG: amidohydrolase family protein [Verrucomicrobia bacterium]|nr:amidohydrolase family protein [Verrucomicrobiota bacterium]